MDDWTLSCARWSNTERAALPPITVAEKLRPTRIAEYSQLLREERIASKDVSLQQTWAQPYSSVLAVLGQSEGREDKAAGLAPPANSGLGRLPRHRTRALETSSSVHHSGEQIYPTQAMREAVHWRMRLFVNYNNMFSNYFMFAKCNLTSQRINNETMANCKIKLTVYWLFISFVIWLFLQT